MSNSLIIGKIYNLKFYDSCEYADVEDYLQSVAKLSDTYKLIGEGMIPWGDKDITKCEKFKYYLFKNSDDKIIEVFIDVFDEEHRYSSLVFYTGVKFITDNYSTYIDYGSLDFPDFSGGCNHIRVNIELEEDQEW